MSEDWICWPDSEKEPMLISWYDKKNGVAYAVSRENYKAFTCTNPGTREEIPELKALGGKIFRLYVSDDYYFVYGNINGSEGLYCVERSTGEVCAKLPGVSIFTFTPSGYLIYADHDNSNNQILYKVPAGAIDQTSRREKLLDLNKKKIWLKQIACDNKEILFGIGGEYEYDNAVLIEYSLSSGSYKRIMFGMDPSAQTELCARNGFAFHIYVYNGAAMIEEFKPSTEEGDLFLALSESSTVTNVSLYSYKSSEPPVIAYVENGVYKYARYYPNDKKWKYSKLERKSGSSITSILDQ